MSSRRTVIQTYRRLFRTGLRAIQFAKPQRYTFRDRLRLAFRKNPPSAFNAKKIDNTLEFLSCAEKEAGLEHRILKNILFLWWHQAAGAKAKGSPKYLGHDEMRLRATAYDSIDHQIHMLNESMDLCIPIMTVRNPM